MRTDDAKASLTIKHIISKMKFTMVDRFLNDNVSFDCLGRKGLHLNSKGVGRLAVNLLSRMRRFSSNLNPNGNNFKPRRHHISPFKHLFPANL